jgi:hypothetical protein
MEKHKDLAKDIRLQQRQKHFHSSKTLIFMPLLPIRIGLLQGLLKPYRYLIKPEILGYHGRRQYRRRGIDDMLS